MRFWSWSVDFLHFGAILTSCQIWGVPGIFFKMHDRNGLKFYMLMYPDHLWNWLYFGHDLLIFLILVAFWLVKQVKFVVSGYFLENMGGMSWNMICWCILTTLGLIWFRSWFGEFPHICHDRSLGAVSIRKTVLPGMAIPMLKIRRPNGRLIFNMEIAIRR